MKALMEQLSGSKIINHRENVGILNVSQRVKLIYGSQYGLELQSEQGSGTRARILLPVLMPDHLD